MTAPVEVALEHRAPIELDALLAFLARRAVAGIEEVADGAYRRSVRLAGGPAVLEVRPGGGGVRARLWLHDERDLAQAVGACRALLDLDCDPAAVLAALRTDAVVGALVRAAPGRRVPGAVDRRELAVRAVLGQQVSLAAAARLAGRLVAEHGEPLPRPVGRVTRLFPSTETLAALEPAALAMPRSRAAALLAVASAPDLGPDRLLGLRGIGPWTVEYIRMRALGDPDAFPATDLGLLHALARLGLDHSPRAVERLSERWRPYRAYALMHLWALLGEKNAPAGSLTGKVRSEPMKGPLE